MFCTLNHHRWELGHKRGPAESISTKFNSSKWMNVSDKPDRPQVLINAVTGEVETIVENQMSGYPTLQELTSSSFIVYLEKVLNGLQS
jgi:hypothetical protein